MPDTKDFLEGFGFHQHMVIDNYALIDLSIGHDQIIRNKLYQYPITLTFRYNFLNETETTYYPLFHSVVRMASPTLIINSRYGNPYKCWIDYQQISLQRNPDNSITFSMLGHGERVYQ